jgi:hypothetical protein
VIRITTTCDMDNFFRSVTEARKSARHGRRRRNVRCSPHRFRPLADELLPVQDLPIAIAVPIFLLFPVSPQLLACRHRCPPRGKWNPVRAGDERFRKSPQRGQRAVLSTTLATMPAIASTGAMLFTGHKGTSGKSALARRTESSTRLANTDGAAQVSGTSDCASRRDQLLFIELTAARQPQLSLFPHPFQPSSGIPRSHCSYLVAISPFQQNRVWHDSCIP